MIDASPSSLKVRFSDDNFEFIQEVVARNAGINLTDKKRELVYGRLWKRVRDLGFGSFEEYCDMLARDPAEIGNCINAITTNVTSFFREAHHFEFLKQWLVEQDQVRGRGEKSLRIWSAGCSSGEEPYSLALTVLESGIKLEDWNIEIMASDIDSSILNKAQVGVYKDSQKKNIPASSIQYFQEGFNSNNGLIRIGAKPRALIQFRTLNLLGSWEDLEGKFDFVFCRNVIIYFSTEDRKRLLGRIFERLRPGGYLMLGHSESIHGSNFGYRVVGQTIHQRRK